MKDDHDWVVDPLPPTFGHKQNCKCNYKCIICELTRYIQTGCFISDMSTNGYYETNKSDSKIEYMPCNEYLMKNVLD